MVGAAHPYQTGRRGADELRLFFAIYPPVEVQGVLATAANRLRSSCGGRAVPAQRIHLTLAFIGPTPRERLEAIIAAASPVTADPFVLSIDTLGRFRKTGIVWAGCSSHEAVSAFADTLHIALRQAGCALEVRRYVPHITLLRDVSVGISAHDAVKVQWKVSEFMLMQSINQGAALVYRPIHVFPVRRASPGI